MKAGAANFGTAISIATAAWLFASTQLLPAQVFEVKAGASSLYDSDGGTVIIHGRGFEATGGLGLVGGRFTGGAQMIKKTERATYLFGSEDIPFNLPTDIFDADHYLTGIGVGVKTRFQSSEVFAFAGETSTAFNSPFFDGAFADRPAAVLIFRDKVAAKLTAISTVLVTRQTTMIQSFDWRPKPNLRTALSLGVGASQPYAAASFALARKAFDIKAAYIAAGSHFRRADVGTPLISEPTRENIELTYRPTRTVSLTASRQNYLTPATAIPSLISNPAANPVTITNTQSTVNQISASCAIAGTSLSASVFDSSYRGYGDIALAISASRRLTQRSTLQASFLESRPRQETQIGSQNGNASSSFVANLQENLSPRWTISQVLNVSNGQTTAGIGGSFLSNRFTFSADYQTYYVPERPATPFQQALIVDAKLHVFDRFAIGGGTFVAPDGRLLYTAQVETEFDREQANSNKSERDTIGNMILQGRVVDSQGIPILGAALLVDDSQIYTDSQGYFFMRERKPRKHSLLVLVHLFLDGAIYQVVSAPVSIESSPEPSQQEALIIVRALSPDAESRGTQGNPK